MRLPLALAALLLATCAQASPGADGADLDQLLSEKGLLGKIEQVRHSVGSKASELVLNAMGFLGVPYRRGGTNADTGFDCSGFVRAMYEQTIGLALPRKAAQQAAVTEKIERTNLKPGDLVFFNTMRRAFSHVGIYVGDGKFIHSPRSGGEIRVEDMGLRYWKRRFDGARRVSPSLSATPATAAPAAAAIPVESQDDRPNPPHQS